jgi:hypothetical protein
MTRAPNEMRCRSIPISDMTKNVAASTIGIVRATTKPARQPSAMNEHDGDRFGERLEEFADRFGDDLGLVRDLAELDSDRQVLLDALQYSLNRSANLGDVGAGRHGGTEQHRLPALVVRLGGRRVLEAPSDLGNVAEPECLLSGAKDSSRMSSSDLSPPSTSMRTDLSPV